MDFDPCMLPEGPYSEFYSYWRSLWNDDVPPHIDTFESMEIPHIISSLVILDIIDERIVVRFSGAGLVHETGQDPTGMDFDMLPNMEVPTQRALKCITDGEPYYHTELPIVWTSREYKTYSTLGLPLYDDAGKITRIVYLMIFK